MVIASVCLFVMRKNSKTIFTQDGDLPDSVFIKHDMDPYLVTALRTAFVIFLIIPAYIAQNLFF